MKRLLRPWALYTLCLGLGLAAMGWITHSALKTERAEIAAQQKVALEEKTRLALWRMDSTLALFIGPESTRPYFHYDAFHPAEKAYTRNQTKAGEILMPSPMLILDDPLVLLRFQIDPQGHFSSPLVPTPEFHRLAVNVVSDPQRLDQASRRLDEIRHILSRTSVLASITQQGATLLSLENIQSLQAKTQDPTSRSKVHLASPFMVYEGAWTPFWQGKSLIMARQVWVGDRDFLQGCWLDWPAVKEVLMSTLRDQLPNADLVPLTEVGASERSGRMSSLPIRLIPGRVTIKVPSQSPARFALIFGWSCTVLAGLAGALILRRAVQLSESRGAFASAVTHELRSPLTTFRLYTELLAFGMVPEAERPSLFNILLAETDRLDHLVKNVLAYARLESRRGVNPEPMTLGDLLDRLSPRLTERARQSDLALNLEVDESLRILLLSTDLSVVEQILFNLVDNACKYAASATNRTLHLRASRGDGAIELRVRDHGPGIAPADRRHLFQPFHKPAQKAARSAPGVGLGLALCRRLAKDLGGDLRPEEGVQDGACFVLRLPRAD